MRPPHKFTVGSLFSGIGGLELGLEMTGGFKTIWQVEIDDYANKVLAKHWPDVPRYRDVRECHGELADAISDGLEGERGERVIAGQVGLCDREGGDKEQVILPYVDLICGGFPCQDVSLAGARAGLDGKRSTLWSEFARLIREIRPRWILAENVGGLLSSDDGRFFGNILRDLAGAGYDAEWGVLSAADMGAPHLRKRVFIVAHACEQRRQQVAGGTPSDEGKNEGRTTVNDNEPPGDGESDGAGHVPHTNGQQQGRWQQPERITDRRDADLAGHGAEGELADAEGGGQPELRQSSGGGGQPERRGEIGDATKPGLSDGSTGTMGGPGTVTQPERPDWWAVEPNVGRVAYGVRSRVDRLRSLGNAVVPQCAEWIGRRIMEGQP
jgi:DNA (cytosine-5)-methyltransferase 1